MSDFKPTLNKPVNDQSKGFEKNFKNAMGNDGINFDEVNGMLNEKEQSLKKKIFSLPKMESLVFSDPKLTALYDEMSENGEEKYGYHYNETIMNMLFNDYVLNSSKYLQKYKNSIPKEKKRRDKSGINKLKKDVSGVKNENLMEDDVNDVTKVVFLKHKNDPEIYAYFPEMKHSERYNMGYSHTGQHGAIDPNYANQSYEATPEEYESLQSELEGLGYQLEVLNGINESTTAGSAGGAAGYVGYAGPAAWKKGGDLMEDEKMDMITKPLQFVNTMNENYLINPNKFTEIYNSLNEESESKSQQRFMGMVRAVQKGELDANKVGDKVSKAAKEMKPKDVKDFASTKHDELPEKVNEQLSLQDTVEYVGDRNGEEPFELGGVKWQFVTAKYPDGKTDIGVYRYGHDLVYDYSRWQEEMGINENNIKEDTQTMIEPNGMSMSNKPAPSDGSSSNVEMGMNAMNENKFFEELDNELNAFDMHLNSLKHLKEEKKTPSMINKDRVASENPKNFKQDLKASGTKEVIDVEKELEWKDQQTNVTDPQKLANDIEKKEIQVTKANGDETLKNVGDSSNNKGDEIPKRNLSEKEANEVDLYRKGVGDYVYDNKPDERFEDRMKNDMGDDLYKLRKEKIEFEAGRPLYNKDTQPTEDGEKRIQYNKDATGWNDGKGLSESRISGRYRDIYGKSKFIDFKLNEAKLVESITDNMFEINVNGMGNGYDNKVNVNENINTIFENYTYYTNGAEIFVMKIDKTSINENLDINKLSHLIGYNPKDFVNTKKNRIIK